MQQLKKLLQDSALLYGAQIGAMVVSFVATIFITRALGPEGRGVFSWLMSLMALATHALLFGMDLLNRRHVSMMPQLSAPMIGNTLAVTGLAALVGVPLFFWLATATDIGHAYAPLVFVALLAAPMGVLVMAWASVLTANNQVGATARITFLPKLGLTALLFVLVVKNTVTVHSVIMVNVVAAFCGVVYCSWLVRQWLRPLRYDFSLLKGMWRYALGGYVAGLLLFLLQKLDILMLGSLSGAQATGYYGVAVVLTDMMLILPGALGYVLMAKLAGQQSTQQRWQLRLQAYGLTVGIMALGAAFTGFLAPWLILLLFGEAFAASVPLLQILCMSVIPMTFLLLTQNSLAATGRARHLVCGPLIGVLVNMALNFAWIPIYGATGAAWASVLAYSFAALVSGLLDYRQSHKPVHATE